MLATMTTGSFFLGHLYICRDDLGDHIVRFFYESKKQNDFNRVLNYDGKLVDEMFLFFVCGSLPCYLQATHRHRTRSNSNRKATTAPITRATSLVWVSSYSEISSLGECDNELTGMYSVVIINITINM